MIANKLFFNLVEKFRRSFICPDYCRLFYM